MTLEFNVPDMACGACATTIAKAVTAIDAAATIDADPKTKQVKVETQQSEAAIRNSIVAAGYTVA